MASDGFARGHQVSRVLTVAIPVILIAVWWGWKSGHGEVVSRSEVAAEVVQVDGRTSLVRIETGEEVRIVTPPDARKGMTLRMRRTVYEDGAQLFSRMASPAPDGAE